MTNEIYQLTRHQYINLETFRKSGEGVRTPVWFVQEGDTLYIRTIADSGKVKRIRNNGRVNIAPCKVDGELLGEWTPALAREVSDEIASCNIDRLFDKKYGLMKKLFAAASVLRKSKSSFLQLSRIEWGFKWDP